MEPENVECDLQSLRRLYSLLESNSSHESLPCAYLLDENTQFLLKRLLDSATQELIARQSKILAAAQLGLPDTISPRVELHRVKPLNVVDSSNRNSIKVCNYRRDEEYSESKLPSTSIASASPARMSQVDFSSKTQINGSRIQRIGKPLDGKSMPKRDRMLPPTSDIIKLPIKDDLREEVADAIERIETQISALRLCSRRVESDDNENVLRTKPCKSRSSVTPIRDYSSGIPYGGQETQITSEKQQSFRPSMSNLRSSNIPQIGQTATSSNLSPSWRSSYGVNTAETRTLHPHSQGSCSPFDQFPRVKSRPPLPPPPRPVRSVGFSNASNRNKTSRKVSMKPTLLDQEPEFWEEDPVEKESIRTRTRTIQSTSSEDELVSIDQNSEKTSGENESNSSSTWTSQSETASETNTQSYSSVPSLTNASSSRRGQDEDEEEEEESNSSNQTQSDDYEVSESPPYKETDTKQRKSAMGRFKRFKNKLGLIFHHHHHHHHHHHNENRRKPSAWKKLQSTFHKKSNTETVHKRRKSEPKGLTTHKHQGGRQFHALVEGMMRHIKHSKKSKTSKTKLQNHGRKMHWWQTFKRQGGAKFPKRGRVKLGYVGKRC